MYPAMVDSEVTVAAEVEHWRSQIQAAWQKSVESTVEVGRLVKQAKKELGASYKDLEATLPFSASTATNFVKIAEHPVLSDPENWKNLPNALNTLYYLSMIDEARLVACLGSGQITPELTVARAKALAKAPARDAANDGALGVDDELCHRQVVFSIPEPDDLQKFLNEMDKLAARYNGTLDHPMNKRSVREWRRRLALLNTLEEIADSEDKLQNVNLAQLRMLEEAEAYLTKARSAGRSREGQAEARGATDPCLPDDYKDFEPLVELLGEGEITNKVIKRWCKEKAVPTRLALSEVAQEVYVWEQLRLLAGREDEKGARKRLEKMANAKKHPAIARAAKDALEQIARFLE